MPTLYCSSHDGICPVYRDAMILTDTPITEADARCALLGPSPGRCRADELYEHMLCVNEKLRLKRERAAERQRERRRRKRAQQEFERYNNPRQLTLPGMVPVRLAPPV